MVWLNRLILLFSLLFSSSNLFSNELNDDEQMYFNFIDLNNDDPIWLLEVNQSISLIFQIVDLNQDGFISKVEIGELKNIIDSLKWVFGEE